MKTQLGIILTLFAALVIACNQNQVQNPAPSQDKDSKAMGKADAWNSANDPSLFASNLVYAFASLPLQGEAANIPWAGSYWPVAEDTINKRWNGENTDSPAKKYEKAFGGSNVELKVSQNHGIMSQSHRTACTGDSDCDDSKGESCSKRYGEANGRCIPTWFGICHAWAPVSILEPEPKRPVTKNGVTFKVNDLKALITLLYNKTYSKFVSMRCNDNDPDIAFDNYGRPTSDQCRDTNAGTFHVIAANYLGLKHQSYVEDKTYDDEVWNQPVRSYEVMEHRQVNAAEANALIGVTSTGGSTENYNGTVAKSAWKHYGPFTVEAGSKVRAVMTGSGDADLYVKFGAQPTSSSYDCRPYAGSSNETCEPTVPSGQTKVYVSVNGYAASSDFELSVMYGGGVADQYMFNPNAAEFIYVKTKFKYITESSASTDGNLSGNIDSYTRSDTYEYVLELDSQGRIIGGEWVGSSKRSHPDFLWLPTGRRESSVAGGAINYAKVKALIDESITDNSGGNTGGGVKTFEASEAITKNEWKHYGPFDIKAGTTLAAVMTGNGDADLYVRKGAKPTASNYDCRPYKGSTNETCNVSGSGPIYVSIQGYAANSSFTLKVTYTEAGSTDTPPVNTTTHLNESGQVDYHGMKRFTVAVSAGKKIVVRTLAANDIDLYVKMGTQPTTASYESRGYTSSGNETISYVPASSGTLHVMIYGYAASDFTLTTADQ